MTHPQFGCRQRRSFHGNFVGIYMDKSLWRCLTWTQPLTMHKKGIPKPSTIEDYFRLGTQLINCWKFFNLCVSSRNLKEKKYFEYPLKINTIFKLMLPPCRFYYSSIHFRLFAFQICFNQIVNPESKHIQRIIIIMNT